MAQLSVNYIEFSCRNIPAIKAFYEAAFGWTFTDYGPDYTAFNDGKLDGGFYHNAEHTPGGQPLVILYTEALEAAREKVKASGGTIAEDIFAFPGGRRFHFADPDGNVLAVWSDKE
ncbi:VOC family protein [Taibaiella helva]|uniref:VOC family protein n=1 Tax=Taibaiella helva TaxID=2301235 RepID=UPI000E569EF4|nr:VOC family protein [Taibaiella helva]